VAGDPLHASTIQPSFDGSRRLRLTELHAPDTPRSHALVMVFSLLFPN
jgi:hypothetical protein